MCAKQTPQSWDDSNDALLVHLKETEKLGWKEIAKHFNNRTSNACQFRWRRLKSGQLKNSKPSALNATSSLGLGSGLSSGSASGSGSGSNSNSNSNSNPSSVTKPAHNRTSSNSINVSLINSRLDPVGDKNFESWSLEEDQLIKERFFKQLSLLELSVLLPSHSIDSIKLRINFLEKRKLSIASLLSCNSDNESVFSPSNSSNCSVSSLSPPATPTILNNLALHSLENRIVLPPIFNSENKKNDSHLSSHSNNLPPLSSIYALIN